MQLAQQQPPPLQLAVAAVVANASHALRAALSTATAPPQLSVHSAGAAINNTTMPLAAAATRNSTLQQQQQLTADAVSEELELALLGFPPQSETLDTAIPLTAIFAVLLVTGVLGNLCTAIVIARPANKYMHTATNYYLFSLAMSDLLFLLLGLPNEMFSLWHKYPYEFGETVCIARGYLSEAATNASILTIVAFTVERYVAICYPFYAHSMSKLPRAVTSIIAIWLLAALCAVPPAAELGIVKQAGPITNKTLDSSAQCTSKRTIISNMFELSAICFFLIPMIIVTVLYILIAIKLRNSSHRNSAVLQLHLNQCQAYKQKHKRSQRSVIRMLVAVVVSFFVCWLPFHAQRLLASYLTKQGQSPPLLDLFSKLTYVSGITYYLSSTINPILYQLMSAKFRLAFKETFDRPTLAFLRCFSKLYHTTEAIKTKTANRKQTNRPSIDNLLDNN